MRPADDLPVENFWHERVRSPHQDALNAPQPVPSAPHALRSVSVLCSASVVCSFMTYQPSLGSRAPLEGLGSHPVVEDHPSGCLWRDRRQNFRRRRQFRRNGRQHHPPSLWQASLGRCSVGSLLGSLSLASLAHSVILGSVCLHRSFYV